jgi:hypothetical protein
VKSVDLDVFDWHDALQKFPNAIDISLHLTNFEIPDIPRILPSSAEDLVLHFWDMEDTDMLKRKLSSIKAPSINTLHFSVDKAYVPTPSVHIPFDVLAHFVGNAECQKLDTFVSEDMYLHWSDLDSLGKALAFENPYHMYRNLQNETGIISGQLKTYKIGSLLTI